MQLQWEIGRGKEPTEWHPSQVPGAVQLDWAAAQGWEEWWKESNWKQHSGLEDSFWTYRTFIPAQPCPCLLRFSGIDYERTILLNGEPVHEGAGMMIPVELILALDEPAEVKVVLHPAPKDPTAPAPNHEFRRSTKPGVSYGWDFHPRLIPLGIWDEVDLIPLTKGRILSEDIGQKLADDLSSVQISLKADVVDDSVSWVITDAQGAQVAKAEGKEAQIILDSPVLWWPHDQGEPHLYTATAKTSTDEKSVRFGVRRVRLVMHEGAWNYPASMPKSRSHPPMTLEVNGRRIFGKGSNWVPPDIFPGRVERSQVQALLEMAKASHMNLLRLWGGGPVQKGFFYDLCDELGIMVWQEFPLACSSYPDDADYLELLDKESRAIIRRVKSHACLALWSGGNELFNSWSGMTDQSLALRKLNANCLELDPHTPFIPTSPLDGVGHGPYTFLDLNTKKPAWESFQESNCTAYCEFGCGGIANLETLRSFLPKDAEFPPQAGGVWEEHHAFNAWCGNSWLTQETIDSILGPSKSIEELVEKGQLLQAEGFKGLFEEARRQKPTCSMALNWCFNEPWPTAANNSLVCWPASPKPALAAVRDALRPVLVSARIPRFDWRASDDLCIELWVLNDSPDSVPGGRVQVFLNGANLAGWEFVGAPPFENLAGPPLRLSLKDVEPGRFRLSLEVQGRPEMSSSYVLSLLD